MLDLIQGCQIGGIDCVKIDNGSAQGTNILAVAPDKTLIVYGKMNKPIHGFIGTFGLPNLSKLKTIVNFEEYDETSNISVTTETRDGNPSPAAIHFETKNGDFINDYRLMGANVVSGFVPNVAFNEPAWNVEFIPTVLGISRLKKQANANSDENNFLVKVENKNLVIYFGDHSNHSGNFVFQTDVTGKLTRNWQWPVKIFLSIMDLSGDKIIRISDAGAMSITVDSGLAVYRYILPALSK